MRACFIGYAVQAIIINFAPLLFITFQNTYGIPLEKITVLITVAFVFQLLIDLLSVLFVDKIGYRISAVCAHILCALGLIFMTFLPSLFNDAFVGLLISVMVYAVGGGLIEVVISPIVESCPNDNKEKAMSLLHSFYCWGSVCVILVSTVFFSSFGTSNWKYLTLFWSLIPIINSVIFLKVPIGKLIKDGGERLKLSELFKTRGFVLFLILMFCAGACEISITQWASAYSEKAAGIPKTLGDVFGPMLFALVMGFARLTFGKTERKLNLKNVMFVSALLCLASYLLISLSSSHVLMYFGFALCGLSVAILWPGTFSLASASITRGGTAMFALLAFAGDIGCTLGPSFVGLISGVFSDNLRIGVLCATIFPVLLIFSLVVARRAVKNEGH